MTKSEFKSLIKEAILELIAEGHLSKNISSANGLESKGNLSEIEMRGKNLSSLIRQSSINQSTTSESHKSNALLNILADTAQTTYVKQQQIEKTGLTSAEKEKFDGMFPSELKNFFEKQFPSKF